ncbi:hypothetical protein [Streptomyces sp. NPDC055099]
MTSIPENTPANHRDIDLSLARIDHELRQIAKQEASAKQERRFLRRARRAQLGCTRTRIIRTAFRALLVLIGTIAFVIGVVMLATGTPGSKNVFEMATAAWGLAAALPPK